MELFKVRSCSFGLWTMTNKERVLILQFSYAYNYYSYCMFSWEYFLCSQVTGREVIKYMFGSIPTTCRRAHEEIVSLTRNNWWKCNQSFHRTPEAPTGVSKILITLCAYAEIEKMFVSEIILGAFLYLGTICMK